MLDRLALSTVIRRHQGRRSNRELARAIGVSEGTVSRWRQGKVMPERGNWEPLATALGLSVEELIAEVVRESGGRPDPDRGRRSPDARRRLREKVHAIRQLCNELEAEFDELE